jgi:hypothetical protein
MKIKQANEQFAVLEFGGYRNFITEMIRGRWQNTDLINWTPQGSVKAYVLRSNWVARCPTCRNVMFVQFGEPFYCCDCYMQFNDHHAMNVQYPKQVWEIEQILLMRPNPLNRNWLLGETLEDLISEQQAQGIY